MPRASGTAGSSRVPCYPTGPVRAAHSRSPGLHGRAHPHPPRADDRRGSEIRDSGRGQGLRSIRRCCSCSRSSSARSPCGCENAFTQLTGIHTGDTQPTASRHLPPSNYSPRPHSSQRAREAGPFPWWPSRPLRPGTGITNGLRPRAKHGAYSTSVRAQAPASGGKVIVPCPASASTRSRSASVSMSTSTAVATPMRSISGSALRTVLAMYW